MKHLRSKIKATFSENVFVAALTCELLLVATYWFDVATAAHFQTLHQLFDLDSEGNIPAWFSSSQLFCVAMAFWSCALRKRRQAKPSTLFFVLAGVGALYASSDETAQIHERVTALMGQRYVDWLPEYAAHHFFLVMVAIALLLTICQFLADDVISVWKNYRAAALVGILGVAIALTGAMGVETLGYKLLQGNTETLWYKIEVAVEEFMEMFGGSLVLVSALRMRRHKPQVESEGAKTGVSGLSLARVQ